MSSLSDTACSPVSMTCSRRAHHTYEVTISRQAEAVNHNHSSRLTSVLRELEERKMQKGYNNMLPVATGDAITPEALRKLRYREFGEHQTPHVPYRPEGGDETLPRSESICSGYYDACYRRNRSAESSGTQAATSTATSTLKTARTKLIQFLQTEEFFDEYSFIALMALMLAHMYRLSRAIFEMGCTAQTILGVFVYVWRFMQARVADILTTVGGPQAAYKCATFCAELVVIFTSILLFLWAVFIPACGLIAVIASKIFYLCS